MTSATGVRSRVTVERAVPALAGLMVALSVALAQVSPWWTILPFFVAANLLFYSAVG